MTDDWTDRIVGDRMTVDEQFTDRIAESQFSRQQWGLIMTAVEFDIERPGDPDGARLVADTSNLPAIMPELDKVNQGPPGVGPGGGSPSDSGGILGGIKDALFNGSGDKGGVDRERLEDAEKLVQEYADALQAHLEERGKWREVRRTVAD